jgi:hypothetical protein
MVQYAGMLLVIALIVLAILFGIGGLVIAGLKWLLIIAVILLIAGVVRGFLARGGGWGAPPPPPGAGSQCPAVPGLRLPGLRPDR